MEMKSLTKQSMLKYLEMRKEYKKTRNPELLKEINNFAYNVLSKDEDYYSKVKSYNFTQKQIDDAL